MNHFERVAIFTVIENIESQIKGLKTLIAASAAPVASSGTRETHKVTQTMETDDSILSEEEEMILERELKEAQTRDVARLASRAEKKFQQEWQLTSDTLAGMDQQIDG